MSGEFLFFLFFFEGLSCVSFSSPLVSMAEGLGRGSFVLAVLPRAHHSAASLGPPLLCRSFGGGSRSSPAASGCFPLAEAKDRGRGHRGPLCDRFKPFPVAQATGEELGGMFRQWGRKKGPANGGPRTAVVARRTIPPPRSSRQDVAGSRLATSERVECVCVCVCTWYGWWGGGVRKGGAGMRTLSGPKSLETSSPPRRSLGSSVLRFSPASQGAQSVSFCLLVVHYWVVGGSGVRMTGHLRRLTSGRQ